MVDTLTIGKRHPEYAPSESLNQQVATHMIQRCKWNDGHDECKMSTWPSGKIEFIQIDGNANALITQGLPWAAIAANSLTKAAGLGDDARQDLRSIAKWTNQRLCDSPETLVQSTWLYPRRISDHNCPATRQDLKVMPL